MRSASLALSSLAKPMSAYAAAAAPLCIFFTGYAVMRSCTRGWLSAAKSHAVAQTVMSGMHAYVSIVAISIIQAFNLGVDDPLSQLSLSASKAYFLYDSIVILCFALKDWTLIIHHVMATMMLVGTTSKAYPFALASPVMLMAESSNAFMYPWYLLKDMRAGRDVPFLATALFALTYVPLRTIGLTKVCTELMVAVWKNEKNQNNSYTKSIIFLHPVVALVVMSWWHSYKVAMIAKRAFGSRSRSRSRSSILRNIPSDPAIVVPDKAA